jgi:hypothetical protein
MCWLHKWEYLSFNHRVCLKCGKMGYNIGWATGSYAWVDWQTWEWDGPNQGQPKTVERFFADAKEYDDSANKYNKAIQDTKLQAKERINKAVGGG